MRPADRRVTTPPTQYDLALAALGQIVSDLDEESGELLVDFLEYGLPYRHLDPERRLRLWAEFGLSSTRPDGEDDFDPEEDEALDATATPLGGPGNVVVPRRLVGLDPAACFATVRSWIATAGIPVRERILFPKKGLTDGSKIVLRQGMLPLEGLEVLLHELAHVLIHNGWPALDNDMHAQFEIEAEATAYTLMRLFGHACPGAEPYLGKHRIGSDALLESLLRIDFGVEEALKLLRGQTKRRPRYPRD
jgi:hypothetical protein